MAASYIIAYLVTIIFWIWIIRKYDRFEKEPLKNVLFVFIAGGLISSFPAGFFNHLFAEMIGFDFFSETGTAFTLEKTSLFFGFVGLNEEFWKAAATVLLIRRMKEFDEPADGLVYSMSVAFGFSVFENFDYTEKYGLTTFIYRQINAVPLHIGLAGIWGLGITKAKFQAGEKYFSTLVPYVLIAAVIHAIYNLSATYQVHPLLDAIIPVAIAMLLLSFAVRKIRKYAGMGISSIRLYCPSCGASYEPGSIYCSQCGFKVGDLQP